MSEVIKRLTIADINDIKNKVNNICIKIEQLLKQHRDLLEPLHKYDIIQLKYDCQRSPHNKESWDRKLNSICWDYLQKTCNIQDYMLCTDYDKFMDQIHDTRDLPEFNLTNVTCWLNGLKKNIYESAKKLIQTVYDKAINSTYWTGNKQRKKRNNAGIDKHFIITTYDYCRIFNYYYKPTFTDDFEKACYLIDNKKYPDTPKNIMSIAKYEKKTELSNNYFELKIYKNGNTHFNIINNEILKKLNMLGNGKLSIGENIKIKIL